MPILTLKYRGKEHLKKELQKTLDEVTIKFIVGNIKSNPSINIVLLGHLKFKL